MDELHHDHQTESRIRRAVEDAAPELGLGLEEKAQGRKMVGLLVPAAHSTQDVDETEPPEAAGEDDDQAIADVVDRWEQIQHHEVTEVAADVTADPYAAIAPTWTRLIDSKTLRDWVRSDEFKKQKDTFTPAAGAHRDVSDLEVTYIGPSMACATYRSEEKGENGVYLSQAAAILRREDGGWRIAAITKHAEVAEGSSGES